MAEELIDSYVDRAGVKGDTDFMVASLREVYSEFKKLEAVKIDLKGATGLTQSIPALGQAKTGMDSLAVATQTVKDRIAQMNGKSKEFTDTLLKQAKAQKEAAAAALNDAKAATEAAKAKQIQAKNSEQISKSLANEKKLAEQAANDYLQLSKAYNDAALKAKNLAIAANDLDFKTPAVQEAVKQANDLGNALKKLDASVGQNQRNVGNYKSAFDGLGFSFAQVGRELPSLAINLQTFALAISNNLPMVADELAKTKKEIAALKAEGKETPSLFQRIGKALFSFQTLLSVGITLLTLFADKLFAAADNTKKVKQAVDEANAAFEKQKKAINDIIQAFEDYARIDAEILKRKGATDKQIFESEIEYAKRSLELRKQQKAEGEAELLKLQERFDRAEKISKLKVAKSLVLLERDKTQALIEEKKKQNAELQSEIEKAERDITFRNVQFLNQQDEKNKEAARKRADDAKALAKDAKEAADAEAQLQFDLKAIELQRAIDLNKEIADDQSRSLADRLIAYRQYYNDSITLITEKGELQKVLGTKSEKEIALVVEQVYDEMIRKQLEFEKRREEIKKESVERLSEQERAIMEALEKVIDDSYKRFQKAEEDRTKKQKDEADKRKKIEEDEAAAKKRLQKELADELQNLTFTLLTTNIERQKNELQEQIDLIEKKKQADIEAANQTFTNQQEKAAAIAVIEARAQTQRETLQRKQRDLDIKKAQFEKAQSIVRIIQETAQNVVKYLANPALAALAAAVGAAQLAIVVAQPIPRYKHGKNVNDLYEGPAVVGDGGRKEAIIREDGGVEITPDTPTLTYVKKRDIVLPDASMLSDLVVSGKMGGKLVERTAVIENGNVEAAINEMKRDVVGAIKKIPRPVISVSNVISQRVFHGDSSNQYLNNNLQGLK